MLLTLFGAAEPDLPSGPVPGSAAPTSLPLPCSGGTPLTRSGGSAPALPTSTPASGAPCGCALCPQPRSPGVGPWALRCDLPRPLAPQRLRMGLKPVAWLAYWSSLFFLGDFCIKEPGGVQTWPRSPHVGEQGWSEAAIRAQGMVWEPGHQTLYLHGDGFSPHPLVLPSHGRLSPPHQCVVWAQAVLLTICSPALARPTHLLW